MKHFIIKKKYKKLLVFVLGIFFSFNLFSQTVFFQSAASSADESVTTPVIVLQITSTSPTSSIDYTVTGGTATGGGVDYTLTTGTITFDLAIPGLQQLQFLSFPVVDDMLPEANETIVITLSNPINCILGNGSSSEPIAHTFSILDNEPGPEIQFTSVVSNNTESISPVNFRVELSTISGLDVDVTYTVSGTATSGTDYTLVSGVLTIPAGDSFGNIPAIIIDDALIENDETIQITLSAPVNATLGTNTVHTYTINDNDNPIKVFFQSAASSADESVANPLIILQINSISPTSSIDYTVTGGTATGGGVDYTLTTGTITFNLAIPGLQQLQFLSFPVEDDMLSEANETIFITLSNPVNCNLGDGSAAQTLVHTFSILDNDAPLPVELVSFNASDKNNTVALDWKTASEIDNDFFSVERSSNGVDFFEIGQVAGNGTTNELQRYDYVDKSPLNGVSYYRLRQVDFDGAFEYSPVASVNISLASFAFNVYPNPIEGGHATIEMQNVGEGDASISVYNSVGKVVLNKTVVLNPNQALKYDLAFERNIPTGIYIVEVRSGQNRYIRKVVIQ